MAIKKRVPNKVPARRAYETKYPIDKLQPDAEIIADIGTLRYSLSLVVEGVLIEEKKGWFDPTGGTAVVLCGEGVSATVTFDSSTVDVKWR